MRSQNIGSCGPLAVLTRSARFKVMLTGGHHVDPHRMRVTSASSLTSCIIGGALDHWTSQDVWRFRGCAWFPSEAAKCAAGEMSCNAFVALRPALGCSAPSQVITACPVPRGAQRPRRMPLPVEGRHAAVKCQVCDLLTQKPAFSEKQAQLCWFCTCGNVDTSFNFPCSERSAP